MADSRKHDRVPCRLRCRCEADHLTVFARIENLSEGGLFIRTSMPLERGTKAKVSISLALPGAPEAEGEGLGQGWFSRASLQARAEVRWARAEGNGGPPGMGLRFEGLDEQALREIRRLVASEAGG